MSSILKTQKFVKEQFKKFPHFSFNDGRIMYAHSLRVKNLALKIARGTKANKTLVAIAALLHDIGKTKKANLEELHYNHEDFNLTQATPLIESLPLTKRDKKKLESLISFSKKSFELKILKDADTLALYEDKKLYTLYIKWAVKEKLWSSITRKVEKYNKLYFPISKKIGRPKLKRMIKMWNAYLAKAPPNMRDLSVFLKS